VIIGVFMEKELKNLKKLKNLQDTKRFAEEFLSEVLRGDEERNVILLQGELGTGKTTFSQFLLGKIGAKGPFTSPTFVIMKKYELRRRASQLSQKLRSPASQLKNIYHLDCCRVDEESVLDLGWEEIVGDKRNLVLVEWPEKIKQIWPEKHWLLKFSYGSGKMNREVKIVKI